MYEKIKSWYDMGLWDKRKCKDAVKKGKLSKSEYEKITGEKYNA